jgi:hypothetical protein
MKITNLILGVMAVLAAPLFFVGCATKPYRAKADEPLYGIWVNEEYANMGTGYEIGRDVKFVFDAEERFFKCNSTSVEKPIMEGRLTFYVKWTDRKGYVYYKAEYTSRWYPYDENPDFIPRSHWYALLRVNPAGDVLGSVWNETKYPEELSHVAGWYEIHCRPE